MDIIILLSFFITLIQLGGAYLRYLPFAPLLSAERRRFLLQCFLIWGSIDFILKTYLFQIVDLSIPTYKLVLSVAWLPYFLISLYIMSTKIGRASCRERV